jgi:hypothetical protein
MQRAFQFITVEHVGDVFCVSLQQPYVEDEQLEDLGAELNRLIDEDNCQKMVLNLGPEDPHCLYSVFLAKLIHLRQRLVIGHASDIVRGLLRTAGIEKFFHFFPDQDAAVQALRGHP